LAAEAEAREKKRKAEGKPIESVPVALAIEDAKDFVMDEEASKRRKVVQEAMDLDKDDEDSDASDQDKDDRYAHAPRISPCC